MAYDNILNAIKGHGGLTPAQEVANYNAFSDLQKRGVYLPDLLKRIETLEAQLSAKSRIESETDEEVFATMERAVRDDPQVAEARARVKAEKSRVLTEMCLKDERFRESAETYRKTVSRVYVDAKKADKPARTARDGTKGGDAVPVVGEGA